MLLIRRIVTNKNKIYPSNNLIHHKSRDAAGALLPNNKYVICHFKVVVFYLKKVELKFNKNGRSTKFITTIQYK